MSFSLIDICSHCGWSTEDFIMTACVAVVLGIVIGMARHLLRG